MDWRVELLRGVAAVMVMLCHYLPHLGGQWRVFGFFYTGVSLFFVISGYVFGRYMDGGRVDGFDFWVRRLSRIYPLYVVSLIVYVWLLWLAEGGIDWNRVWPFLFMLQNQFYDALLYLSPVYWTLPVEMGFYMLVFLVTRGVGVYLLLVVGVCYSVGLRLLFFNDFIGLESANILRGVVFFDFHAFFLGYVVFKWWKVLMRFWVGVWGFVLWAVLWGCWIYFEIGQRPLGNGWVHGVYGFLEPLAMAGVLAGVLSWPAEPKARLARLSLGLGALSYGLYLLHMAPLKWALWKGFPLSDGWVLGMCGVVSLAVAYAVHRGVEAPAMRWGRAWSVGRKRSH